ncbi:hypothetical protein ACTHGU_03670 [Chitinophagaceae bacterium MMS25-I14]
MKSRNLIIRWLVVPLLLTMLAVQGYGQQNMVVNLDLLDGVELTPANMFSFQVINNSGGSQSAVFTGSVRYRGSNLRMGYTFHATLSPGMNTLSRDRATSLTWSFSDPALKDLFTNYSKLPEGNYEYCVSLKPGSPGSESQPPPVAEGCVYNQSKDLFLINLVDPENKAKLYEQYPMLSWAVTSPLAGSLTYRVRVAELKKGQNGVNAITRNPPMYEERNVTGNSIQYPVTAKPLEKWQPYVWTVDAYYKGLLLGGAETWQFMIVDDSTLKGLPHESYFVDVRKEKNAAVYYAVGKLKLKYVLDEKLQDVLTVSLTDKSGNTIKLKEKTLAAVEGDNRYVIDLQEEASLTHLGSYQFTITNTKGEQFVLPVKYVNPDYL